MPVVVTRHLVYLGVLAVCLCCALWLEPLLRVGVLRRWRRLLLTVLPVAAVFVAWDVGAIAAGHWSYDPGQLLGVILPGRLPLEEVLFFLVVPLCAILGFEAVRKVTRWPVHDRRPDRTDTMDTSTNTMDARTNTVDARTSTMDTGTDTVDVSSDTADVR
jgi:lycopene cyclase domain-containing protein